VSAGRAPVDRPVMDVCEHRTMDGRRSASGRTAAQRAGDTAEELVAARLSDAGWTVLARNVHVGRPELELGAIDPGPPQSLVIVAVRWRRRRDVGLAQETFGHRKRGHLRLALGRLLEDGLPDGRPIPRLPVRIDLVAVEPRLGADPAARLRHHRNALDA
jgi:Holliday junction resolvase-like predicted endonuclease